MADSKVGKWSIPEAENAIKAMFFQRARPESGLASLRWRDFCALRKGEKAISPRTLGRALNSLEDKGELIQTNKEYTLVLERSDEEFLDIAASADVSAIRALAKAGGIYDFEAGWSFYAVSSMIPRPVRLRIRAELLEFGARLDELLDREANRFVRSLTGRVGRRLPPKDRRDAERSLRGFLESFHELGSFSGVSLWSVTYLERIAPGATAGFLANFPPYPSDVPGQARWWSRITGESEESILRAARAGEKGAESIKRLLAALPPRARDRAAREIGAWIQLVSSWCAVVRVA